MTRYLIAVAAAALIASQAEAQVIVSSGYYQPVGVYSPLGGVVNTGYYSSGYYSPYHTGYYGGYSTPMWSGYSPSYYNTSYDNSYYRPGLGMYRRWRW